MQLLLGLICFVIAVVLMTVVGHGIWVVVAAVFSGGSKSRPRDRERSSRRRYLVCIGCGEEFDREEESCPVCRLDPTGAVADELKDLEASLRTAHKLRDRSALPTESYEQICNSIEARQADLLPRRRRQREDAPVVTPATSLTKLESWFGADLGRTLTVDERRQALAMAKLLSAADLRELSAHALVGIARLLSAVGMMTRACQVYRALFQCHPTASITGDAAIEALEVAYKLKEWPSADEIVHAVTQVPGLVDERPELERLIAQISARGRDAVPPPLPARVNERSEPEPVVAPMSSHARDAAPPPMVVRAPTPRSTAPPVVVPVAEVVEVRPIAEPAPVKASLPAPPRRSFAEWIAVFMEESNILWGELIGGTLIVGSSIALVISLWSTLEEIPFFPFLILAAITSGLIGAGLYTLHHWKLESTSRGLLLIGTLLVPLDFLVLAGLTRIVGAGLWDYLTAGAALAVFGWLLYRSSRILIQEPLDLPLPSALMVTIALLVSAIAQMLVPVGEDAGEGSGLMLVLVTLMPVLVHAAAIGWLLFGLKNVETWTVGRLVALLIALGSVTFACTLALSSPLYAAANKANVLLALSPAVTLLGVPLLIAGTLIFQKLAHQSTPWEANGLWRTLGTGLALAGLFVMFGGFVASVEDPVHRWICGAINIGVLLAVAWGLRVPALHVPAQVYIATLLVYGLTLDLDAMLHEPMAALRLTGLLLVQALAAEGLIRLHRRTDARYYAVGSAVTTTLVGLLILPFAREHPDTAAQVLGAASLIWYGANLRWRIAEITYACSLVLTAANFFALHHFHDGSITDQLLWSLLAQATVCLTASLSLRGAALDWLRDSFRIPLQFASLFATFAAVAMVGIEQLQGASSWWVSCAASGWLAALWLVIAIVEGWPMLFAGFQLALAFAWFFGASAWLNVQGWAWLNPYSLHIYALGLGTLSLAWEILRIATRKQERAFALLSPAFIPVDRILTGTLVLGQYLLTLAAVSWSIGKELSHSPDLWRVFPVGWHADAYSLAAWLVPLLLAGVLALWLRELDMQLPVLGFTILFLSLPLMIAGAFFDEQRASASAARWALSFSYVVGSMLLWCRQRLGASRAERIPVRTIRTLFIAAAVLPILFLGLCVVIPRFSGQRIPGAIDGVFAVLETSVSLLIPLALVGVTLAGHGFRERLAHYLLAAGWLMTVIQVGGYFLVLQRREMLGEPWIAPFALLIAGGVIGLWSILWTWIASFLEDGERKPLLDSVLLSINSLIGAGFVVLVLVIGLVSIVEPRPGGRLFWMQAAGSPWGWLAFAVCAFGACFLFWKRQASLPLCLLGGLSFTAVGVVACSIESFSAGDGLRTLMLLCGLYACIWVWSNLFIDPAHPPRWLTTSRWQAEMELYACLAGGAAVLLGGASAIFGVHPLASTEAIALTAFASGLLAYYRKTESWASLSTLLAMLASTILVLHLNRDGFDVWLLVIQVNVAVLGAMSLLRIGLHHFFAPPHVQVVIQTQLVGQIALGMLANVLLLSFALLAQLLTPNQLSRSLEMQANWAGWLALVTNVAAAVWHLGLARSRWVVHALGISGLMFGALIAGSMAIAIPRPWMASHALTLAWTLVATFLLVASWVSQARPASFLRFALHPSTTREWVSAYGMFVVAFALTATWGEPATPYWSVGNDFAISALLGAMAIWSRNPLYQFSSGLLFNVIGLLVFRAWASQPPLLSDREWLTYFALAQILSFGAAAIVWSLIEFKLRRANNDLAQLLPLQFPQLALLAAIFLLAIGVTFANAMHLNDEMAAFDLPLAWIALGVLAGACLLELWRPWLHRFTRVQLYTCGLMALGLVLHGMSLSVTDWYWTAMLLLAGYVLLIAGLGRLTLGNPRLQELLHLPTKPDAGGQWFWNVQLVSIGLVLVLSLWVTLTYPTWHDRLGGALASTLVTVAVFLLVQVWPRIYAVEGEGQTSFGSHHRLFPCYLVLSLGVFIALETCWAFIAPEPAVWLQRSAAMLTVVVAATLLYCFGLPRWLAGSTWSEPSRTMGGILGVAGVSLLLLLVGQELLAYDATSRQTPMRIELVICAALAILGLMLLSLYSALSKAADLYGIEGERRSLYVYLTEALAAALFFHLRLNVPDAFSPIIGAYWYLVVMVLAFGGLALSEVTARKNLPVLATPLKRSAIALAFLPVLAFRIAPLASAFTPLVTAVPGLAPFIRYLGTLSNQAVGFMPMESLCWMLLGIFFGSLAQLRKSANYGIAAALAVNFGVWIFLGHQDATTFLERPQLWLIPLGVIILVAEFVNRERLGFWPSLSVRYAGLVCIYLSSTIELIKDGLGSNPIFPIVLALLAVVGMMLGILFRVRAFLLSGFMALLIVIFAQIWLAAVVHANTWVWWVCGIVLGAMILTLFALFEKHRNEVLKMLDSMKRWQ